MLVVLVVVEVERGEDAVEDEQLALGRHHCL